MRELPNFARWQTDLLFTTSMTYTKEERLNIVVNHAFNGWHHVYGKKTVGTGVSFNVYGTLSTFDYNQLTRLVVASHVVRVRAEVAQSGPGMLKVFLHCREDKPDSWSEHHPDGSDLVAMVDKLRGELS